MIRVAITRDGAGRVAAFEVAGHAEWAEKGQDIVCAAVSALSQAAVLGLEERLGIRPAVDVRSGRLTCRLPAGLDGELALRAQDVLETMVLGLKSMAMAYEGYVQVREVSEGGA